MTKKEVKANKIHKCEFCCGNIQKGEIYNHVKVRFPRYDSDDHQIGVGYAEFRHHKRDCYARLLNSPHRLEVLKNCNKGSHKPISDPSPDGNGDMHCEWCGILINDNLNQF